MQNLFPPFGISGENMVSKSSQQMEAPASGGNRNKQYNAHPAFGQGADTLPRRVGGKSTPAKRYR